MSEEELTEEAFSRVCRLMHERAGIIIPNDKAYLVSQRLSSVAASAKLSIDDLIRGIDDHPELATKTVEAMTNNETTFFRDGHPFETLADTIFPDLAARLAHDEPLRVWCGAVSSGQEAFSVAVVASERANSDSHPVHILGTDLSNAMVERARTGRYSDFETTRGMNTTRRARWFTQSDGQWTAVTELRQMVRFEQLDVRDSWASIPPQHLILMRNLMIYLDDATRLSLMSRAAEKLAPGGYLLLGAVETIPDSIPKLERRILGKTLCFQRTS